MRVCRAADRDRLAKPVAGSPDPASEQCSRAQLTGPVAAIRFPTRLQRRSVLCPGQVLSLPPSSGQPERPPASSQEQLAKVGRELLEPPSFSCAASRSRRASSARPLKLSA